MLGPPQRPFHQFTQFSQWVSKVGLINVLTLQMTKLGHKKHKVLCAGPELEGGGAWI